MRFSRSYLLIVLVTILLVTSSKSYAAFPLKAQTAATTTNTETVAHQTEVDFKTLVNTAIERFTQKPASAPAYSDDMGDGDGLGIASFATGLGGLLALAAVPFVAAVAPLFIGLSITAAIMAIIFGKKSRQRSRSGFAIAGIVMGIVNLSLLILIVLAAFVLLALYVSGNLN